MPVSNIFKENSLWDLFPKCKGALKLKREKNHWVYPQAQLVRFLLYSHRASLWWNSQKTLDKTPAGCRCLSTEPRKLILVTWRLDLELASFFLCFCHFVDFLLLLLFIFLFFLCLFLIFFNLSDHFFLSVLVSPPHFFLFFTIFFP